LDGESLLPLFDESTHGERKKDFARSDHLGRKETVFRMLRTPEWKYTEFPEFPPVLFDMVNDPNEERNLAALPEYAERVKELSEHMWSDGESWESLIARSKADRENAGEDSRVRYDCTPNQYALQNGELVDAEECLYRPYLKA
jgi:arylsulfatase A-like enzyme